MIRPGARALVREHLERDDLCALVTATNSFVTAPIAREFGIAHLIATEPESRDGRFTGYGSNRLAEGKLPLCAEMCSTKSLLAGDGEIIAKIFQERVVRRGYSSGAWGWQTAYRERIES